MVISSGYNIAGPEVEATLTTHESVMECTVIGFPDERLGSLAKYLVVIKEGFSAD